MADEFIEKFHNLEGTLLKEKKKSLFLLLESHKSLKSEDHIIQEINKKLIPKTYLEEIYKLEFLLYFKRTQELFDVLKSGYDITASKIIRQPWFIKTLFEDFKSEVFVQDIFPQLSVAVRSKILKQILKVFKNEEFIDELFDRLLENYGMKPASILLSGCSFNKMKQVLSNKSRQLSRAQLKLIHEKNPSFIENYYEDSYLREGHLFFLEGFSSYLSKKDPSLFMKLSFKYNEAYHKLGRRTTKKYVVENKETLFKNAKKYLEMKILNKNALVKQLAGDFPQFMKAAVPEKVSDLTKSPAFQLLEYYPKNRRYDLYKEIFDDVYKMKLFPNKEFITNEILEVIQCHEERERWVELYGNNIEYVKFKRSSIAVVELKHQLIVCSNIELQEKLTKDIISSCCISNDFNALLDVLNLFCGPLRNVDGSVLFSVLEEIYKKINLNKLSDIHWNYIHHIIRIQYEKKLGVNGCMAFEYSRYLYKNKKNIEEIIQWMRSANNNFLKSINFKNANFKDDRFQKKFLELFLKYNSDRDADFYLRKCIILEIRNWNKKHPDDLILVSENREMIETFKETFSLYNLKCLKYLVCRENLHDEFTDIYFNGMDCLPLWKEERGRGCTDRRNKKRKPRHKECIENITMTKWYLKYKPSVFEDYIDKVVECLHINTRYSLMRFLKKYEHTGLPQKIVKYYLERLKNPKETKLKSKIAQLLSLIMPKNDYLKLLEEYAPQNDKVLETAENEETNIRKIQISLAKSLRYTTCQTEALPVLLKYCRRRFLPPALYSLYCCFHRVPAKSLEQIIDYLMLTPGPLRKHAVFLSALVFPLKIYTELIQTIDNDDNYSLKKHMFTAKYKYFLKYPNQQLWSELQTYIDKLTLNEETLLNLLTNVNDIPEEYRVVFIEKVHKVFNDLEKKEKPSMKLYCNKLIENIGDYNVKILPRNFCLEIISEKLFQGPEKNKVCLDFSVAFLMYGTNMKENIRHFLTILCNYKKTYWYSSDSKQARSTINFICCYVFDKVISKDQLRVPVSREFPRIFEEEWQNAFSIEETFNEYLMLDFLILKYEDNEDSSFYAQELCKMYNDLRVKFGDSVTVIFVDFLSNYLEKLLGWQKYKIKMMTVFAEMLKIDSSLPNLLLVAQLLPKVYVSCKSDIEFKKSYKFVLKTLKNGGEIVQAYLNNHFRERKFYF